MEIGIAFIYFDKINPLVQFENQFFFEWLVTLVDKIKSSI